MCYSRFTASWRLREPNTLFCRTKVKNHRFNLWIFIQDMWTWREFCLFSFFWIYLLCIWIKKNHCRVRYHFWGILLVVLSEIDKQNGWKLCRSEIEKFGGRFVELLLNKVILIDLNYRNYQLFLSLLAIYGKFYPFIRDLIYQYFLVFTVITDISQDY